MVKLSTPSRTGPWLIAFALLVAGVVGCDDSKSSGVSVPNVERGADSSKAMEGAMKSAKDAGKAQAAPGGRGASNVPVTPRS